MAAVDERIRCATCGEVLLESASETGVTPAGSEVEIPFRRATDHVVCPGCGAVYDVVSLAGRPEGSEAAIERLERLAEESSKEG